MTGPRPVEPAPAPTGPVAPPAWLLEAEGRLLADLPDWFTRFAPPPGTERQAAVLMLLGPGPDGPDIVLTERSADLRSHAGQVSFPGGRVDPGETAVQAAVREAHEEVGIDPASVEVVASLPGLYLTPSRNAVTPVLGWWREPGQVRIASAAEVAHAVRVPVAELADPANRFTVRGPRGYTGPAFEVSGLYVWGFTAQLLSVLLDACGLADPWDTGDVRRLPLRFLLPYLKPGGTA